MENKEKVLLIGVGLIGGSVSLAIKKQHDVHVIGYDVNEENIRLAKKLKVIDDYTTDYRKEAGEADLIILACPVEKAEKYLESLSATPLKEEVIITDVGSTKEKMMTLAETYFHGKSVFIGGHPMAGSHKTGPGSARAHLFENAYYILTPATDVRNGKIARLKHWLSGTNANFIIMDPAQHDVVTGVVSHFPHVIAASLVRHVKSYSDENEYVNFLAAGGFRDITRIASSSPELWSDVILHNQKTIISLLEKWELEMETVKGLIQEGNSQALHSFFSGAKQYRDSLPVRAKGAITAFYDLYVDVLDKTGVIAHISTLLAHKNISITNIRIIEAREDVYGVLRLSFQSQEDLEKAKVLLEDNEYETYISV